MTRRWLPLMVFLLSAMVFLTNHALADRTDEGILLDGVAAYVNRHIITIGDVRELMAPAALQLQQHYRGHELDQRLADAYDRALRNLINRALILDAYYASETPVPERLLDARVREITFEQFGDDREAFWRRLDEAGLTLEGWQEQVRESILVSILHNSEVDGRVVVRPGSIQEAYVEAIDRFRMPEQVRLGVIMIRDGDDDATLGELIDLAGSLVARLRDGAQFAALAREYSQGRQAEEGGDWGWMDIAELRPELAEPVRQLAVDEVSDVITIDSHHYVIKVNGRRHERIVPLMEAYEDLHHDVRQQEAGRFYERWIERLESHAVVQPLEHAF